MNNRVHAIFNLSLLLEVSSKRKSPESSWLGALSTGAPVGALALAFYFRVIVLSPEI
jgi:hypothetical protein